jgi:Ran GTPase-activating protein (RanGAP) involved in mRNA processing and transport
MSGGKTRDKQADRHAGKQPGEGTSRDTAAAEDDVHAPGHTHRKSMRLPEMSAAKQAGGKGETKKGNLLAADAFAAALGAIPHDDWGRTWAAGRTIMLRRTSKRVKEVVDKMRLPAVVRLSRSFWDDARNGTDAEKLQSVMRQLPLMTAWCRISTLALPRCDMAEILAGVLAKCPALAHLDLSWNFNFGAAGAEMLSGVLGQCAALVHLNLCHTQIGPDGAEFLAGVLGHCTALAHLDLSGNGIGPAGAESLAAVLVQCTALAHLNLGENWIGPDGTESLAGVLGQCAALAHLNLRHTQIGPAGAKFLAGVLGHCTALAHLDLSGNQIDNAGAESLAGVLGQCRALNYLNLFDNDIRQDGAECLAGVLGQCASLAHLNLGDNAIQDEGAKSLAGVLGQCASLAHLNLHNNEIGPDGAESLAGVLGQCAALTYLNLSKNDIREDGAECLAGVLAQCAALTHLDLGGNRIGAEGTGRLRATWRGPVSGLRLSLTLTVKGEDGSLLHFTINRTNLLKKLMGTYCLRRGLEKDKMCFLFDGNRLSETQTPAELNMEDGDVIDAQKETFKKQDS